MAPQDVQTSGLRNYRSPEFPVSGISGLRNSGLRNFRSPEFRSQKLNGTGRNFPEPAGTEFLVSGISGIFSKGFRLKEGTGKKRCEIAKIAYID